MSTLQKTIVSFVLVFITASAGSLATYDSIPTWYAGLTKPPFNPPNFIFGPVWTVLYFGMAVSLVLVWKAKKSKLQKRAIQVFFIQLFLNFLWSFVFFGAHQLVLSVFVIAALWISIFYSILLFYKISKPAAYLLIPYILWVSFASILNISIAALN